MKKYVFWGIILVWIVGFVVGCSPTAVLQVEEVAEEPVEQPASIPAAEVPLLSVSEAHAYTSEHPDFQEEMIEVTIEGYYNLGGVSYLLDDYEYALANIKWPTDAFIILFGNIPLAENEGQLLSVTGTLEIYTNQYPEFIDDTGGFLAFYVDSFEILGGDLMGPAPEKVQREGYLDERIINGPGCLYVLIVSGSPYSPPTGGEYGNPPRYYNDVLFMYQAATRLGADWIRVLYSNGTAPAAGGFVGGVIPAGTLQSATRANLTTALTAIGKMPIHPDATITNPCEIWILTTNHGSGVELGKIKVPIGGSYDVNNDGRVDDSPPDPSKDGETDGYDEGLVLWKDIIYDDEFASEIDNMRASLDERGIAYKVYVMMEECFSGGFVRELTPLRVTNIATAAMENEPSRGMNNLPFDEFLYYFIGALNTEDPWGGALPGIPPTWPMTWQDAFNYAVLQDTQPETPQFR